MGEGLSYEMAFYEEREQNGKEKKSQTVNLCTVFCAAFLFLRDVFDFQPDYRKEDAG